TGVSAFRLAIAGFIIPFMLVYKPALLLTGTTVPAVIYKAIERLIRGLNPWPSAYTAFEGRTLKLWEAEVTDECSDGQDEYGRIVKEEKDSFLVKTGKGCLR
ncbi:hypothetical protein NE599_21140, partial [[Clostridium] symbiosum]|nr:hypothetical protein [[Clostridium] symbiosum]